MADQKTAPFNTFPEGAAIKELIQHGAALSAVREAGGRHPFAIVPDGFKLEYLKQKEADELPPLLDHIRQSVTLQTPESFVAYVKLFRKGNTRIFATPLDLNALEKFDAAAARFTALLDFHESGAASAPKRNAHVATYPLPLSIELKTWLKKNSEPQGQDAFIKFIEENQIDIIEPTAASLMELVLNFESKSSVVFTSKSNRVSGGRELVFNEKVDIGQGAEGTLKVPEMITLKLPIFEADREYEMKARLEYRPSGGKLNITYHLQRPQKVLREAFKDVHATIECAETGIGIEILTGEAK